MLGIKIEFTGNETLNDVKQATKVAKREFAKAYHRAKARQLEQSLHRLQEIEKEESGK